MKIYAVIAGLLMAFSSLAADVNITNVTRADSIPSGSYALGTTGLVTRLLPISLMSVSTATNVSGGNTNQVYTQTGWSGYPQLTNLSLTTNGSGTAIVPALWLTNTTAAGSGAQQASPALMFGGQGYRSGIPLSTNVSMGFYVLPVQGSSLDPQAQLTVVKGIGGNNPSTTGTYISSGGALVVGDGITSTLGVVCGASSALGVSSRSYLYAPAIGHFNMVDASAFNTFSLLTFGPGITAATRDLSTNWPSIRMESTTNEVTMGIRKGTNNAVGDFASVAMASVILRTNYVATEFAIPTTNSLAGTSRLVVSNNCLYFVTATKTNLIVDGN